MESILKQNQVLEISDYYCDIHKLKAKELFYEVVKIQFLQDGKNYCGFNKPVWVVEYDVAGWDDIWFEVIISDEEKKVLCCHNMWHGTHYPHIDLENEKIIKNKKLTPREKRLAKNKRIV